MTRRISRLRNLLKKERESFPEVLGVARTRGARGLYIGCLGRNNLGDEAIYQATTELFDTTIGLYGTRGAGVLERTASHFLDIDAIFLGGGTLIKKGLSPYLGRLKNVLHAHPESKFVVFGSGVADAALWQTFGITTDTEGWREVLERSEFLGVRGPLSKQHLRNWGVQRQIEIIGDPALWFAKEALEPKLGAKQIGLNLGPSGGRIHGKDEMHVLEFGAQLLRLLESDGWQITMFPMCQADVEYLVEAARRAGIKSPQMHQPFLDLDATLNALEKQDVFVGEKLHSVILSHCTLTPAIMLEYRTKCRDYMLSVEQDSLNYRTDELDAGLIFERLGEVYDNLEGYQNQIFLQMSRWKSVLCEARDKVSSMICR